MDKDNNLFTKDYRYMTAFEQAVIIIVANTIKDYNDPRSCVNHAIGTAEVMCTELNKRYEVG